MRRNLILMICIIGTLLGTILRFEIFSHIYFHANDTEVQILCQNRINITIIRKK